MRFTRVLALRHFTIYGPETFDQQEESGNSAGRIAFLSFAFFLGLLLLHRMYHVLQMEDFAAFYCGGAALRNHLDPYQIASLHECENRVVGVFGHSLFNGQTFPAPLPPFVLAFFALFSFLPVGPASYLWLALTLLAYGVTVLMLRRLSNISTFAIVGGTAIPLMLVAFPMGQLTLPTFAFLMLAAYAWRSGQSRMAAFFALGTMMSPSLGLPVCCVLLLFERSARIPLLMGALLLALVDVTVMPLGATISYLHTVLPAHALAEIHCDEQYSLSHLLTLLHVPAEIAVAAGGWDYVVMLVLGLMLASRLAKDPRRRDLALVVAPTAAMLGGSFVHIQELIVASFTSILIYRDIITDDVCAQRKRKIIFGCMIAFALPLMNVTSLEDLLLYIGMAALLALTLFEVSTKEICLFLAGICLALDGAVHLLTLRIAYIVPAQSFNAALDSAARRGLSLEDVWRIYIDNRLAWKGWVSGVLALPMWVSMTLLILAAATWAGYIRLPHFDRQKSLHL